MPPEESRSPANPDRDTHFTIADTPENAKKKLLVERQDVKNIVLLHTEWKVTRLDPAGRPRCESFETITHLDLIIEKHGMKNPFYEAVKERGKKSSGEGPLPAEHHPPEGHALAADGKMELDAIAKTVRDMSAMGKLKRVIIRAYDDRATVRDQAERERHTETRARWVFDTLTGYYKLPLIDEASRGGTAAVAQELRETVLASLIPTRVVGCGSGDAPPETDSPEYRVAIVDYEEQDAPVREEVDELSTQQRWSFYVRDDGEVGEDGEKKKSCLLHSQLRDGIARDPATVEAFRNDARAYVWLIGAAAGTAMTHQVETINRKILAWDSAGAAALEQSFCVWSPPAAGAVDADRQWNLEPLTTSYDLGYTMRNGETTEVEPLTGLWMPWMKSGQKDHPNHRKELVVYTSIDVMVDDLKLVEVYLGDKYPLAQRIHFAQRASVAEPTAPP